MVKYILSLWDTPIAPFEIFKLYIHIDEIHILASEEVNTIELLLTLFCPCWYNLFSDMSLRVIHNLHANLQRKCNHGLKYYYYLMSLIEVHFNGIINFKKKQSVISIFIQIKNVFMNHLMSYKNI